MFIEKIPVRIISISMFFLLLTAVMLPQNVNALERSTFTTPPKATVIPAIPPLFAGVTSGMSVTGLVSTSGWTPIADAPVRFVGIDPNNSEEIAVCNANTDSSGNASCSALILRAFDHFCVRYDGNSEFSPAVRCNVE